MIGTPPVIIHIGYHRTGTTFLQKCFFVPEKGFINPIPSRGSVSLKRTLIDADTACFNAERVRKSFLQFFDAVPQGIHPVVSYERLSGNPHWGGYDKEIIAKRLQSVFPEGRVLIVIREQKDMIRSLYAKHTMDGAVWTLYEYLFAPRQTVHSYSKKYEPTLSESLGLVKKRVVPLFDFRHIEYHRAVRLYHGLFGKDKVLVLPYEMLEREPEEFMKRIAAFLGKPADAHFSFPRNGRVNISMGYPSLRLQRLLNTMLRISFVKKIEGIPPRHVTAIARFFGRLLPAEIQKRSALDVNKKVRHYVGDRYKKSNTETSQLIGVSLSDYGYDCDE